MAAVKISSVRRKAAQKFGAPQQGHRPLWRVYKRCDWTWHTVYTYITHIHPQNPRKVCRPQAAKNSNHFSPRHVRGEKYLSDCKCGIFALRAKIMRAAGCNPFVGKIQRIFRQGKSEVPEARDPRFLLLCVMLQPISTSQTPLRCPCRRRCTGLPGPSWPRAASASRAAGSQ